MSVNQYVAISKDRLPTTREWESIVEKLGYAIRIDPGDLADHSGYLPIQFLDQTTGFEMYLEEVGEFEEVGADLAGYDLVVQFTTFSEALEGQCAMVCASGLVSFCDGLYFDDDAQIIRDPDKLVGIAKEWIAGS